MPRYCASGLHAARACSHDVGKIGRAQVEPLLASNALEVANHHVEPARRLGQLTDDVADAAERLIRVSRPDAEPG